MYAMSLTTSKQSSKQARQVMKVLRYDWPSHFTFLLDVLINPAKL